MLLGLKVPELPHGVNETLGMCGNQRNAYQTYKAPAYSVNKGAMVTVGASEVCKTQSLINERS